ncbi:hypothetical protein AG1IA_06316 [Rhizoctonia solani AG-1 IA]|uniref:Uncharacterized protein n=1 Tax=Thanatephorus cucumeris (strain AG1-IA) TaxID=983506 RepID=L8WTG0_THACA|nr:hypothetical protein AG1IA_06316 [Rhizoctonia solani AG-1 IA]
MVRVDVAVGFTLWCDKILKIICLPQHESDYGRIDT